jgi:pSer/pThr/pTyr-binding forkhead associated (FHA) protein
VIARVHWLGQAEMRIIRLKIARENKQIDELELVHGAMTIGRGSDNDIPLNDPAASTHHAKIVRLFNAAYVQDLSSTNGTYVNGKKVQMHTLRNGDVITIGHHQIVVQYHSDTAAEPPLSAFPGTDNMLRNNPWGAVSPFGHGRAAPQPIPPSCTPSAHLYILTGPRTGQHVRLNKAENSLGDGTAHYAVIRKHSDGYYLSSMIDWKTPAGVVVRVNDRPIGAETVRLAHKDVIEVDDIIIASFILDSDH